VPRSTGEPGHPVDDEFSHGADALRGLAVIVDQISNDDRKPINVPARRMMDPGVGY
jgi:hypothetical protein